MGVESGTIAGRAGTLGERLMRVATPFAATAERPDPVDARTRVARFAWEFLLASAGHPYGEPRARTLEAYAAAREFCAVTDRYLATGELPELEK